MGKFLYGIYALVVVMAATGANSPGVSMSGGSGSRSSSSSSWGSSSGGSGWSSGGSHK
ncbi:MULTISPECIES: hypothetical protein [Achromobacter]|uniref:Uncharacterized protein n=1 Tax=Achromobacter spanius TaxID=217203 RepID=A0ABY8GZJ9_9BURK|nr:MULTISPECIES: hypothetical protein [Achromobacter]MCD0498775.1 hypothetical protein [Achromobacter sp. MY14]MCW3152150.1 hypothetical protein [Achromobacter spanius]WAI86043.1 hypothetical protein N8Z00_13615 [Achromobacter spanius]WEX96124.1 hypothetical protein N3Z32_08205 [Achromobacter sp. SS2-2022]WFP10157.1 hypothetical protein P8T11_09880 [Achromobacter spanius]